MVSASLERQHPSAVPGRANRTDSSGTVFAAVDRRDLESAIALAEWDDLARDTGEPNPFYEHWSLLPALDAFGERAACTLMVLRCEGRLCGLIPLARAAGYYGYPLPHLANWSHDNLFVGNPLVRRGYEERFWRELLDHADAAPGGALFLHLDRLAEDGPLFAALARIVGEQGRAWAVVQREERAMLQSDLSPQAYFERALNGKKRKELRRQDKRLADEGTRGFERRDDEAGLDRWIEQFLALEKAGWKGRNGSALADDPRTRGWFVQTMRGAAAHGRLERLSLTLDGAPIAMLANFIAPPGAFSFKTAYDERFARYSPGVLLQRENLDLLTRDGIAWCDSCAAADHPMIERIWREKRAMVRVNLAIGGKLRRTVFRQVLRAELARQSRSR
ncbi:GNAT family N-acetyltransferase [Pelagerythrobacter marensis]|uniref:GNAT family N-acetyltransferase n=1 Tax=Pelagerythrobacter marensis TaxID=543877 RepID=A0ABZ2D2J6_9SPHN